MQPALIIRHFQGGARMCNITTDQIKELLFSKIDSLLDQREAFLVNPKSDFTRTKKISFEQTILFPMIAASGDIANELLDFIGEENLPLPSAMVQRRNQVKPEAFIELFKRFTSDVPLPKKFYDYQLVACDGSRLNLPFNPSDMYSFIKSIQKRKGINQVHLNAIYDVLNDIFIDAEIQSIHEMDEKKAFCNFLDKYADSDAKRIYIADRGYASYNVFAHAIHNGQLFMIRVSEKYAKGLLPSNSDWLLEDQVDKEISINIGRRRNKKLANLENYHYMSTSKHYDYAAPRTDDIDTLKLRVLKFPISEDSYEYIVTNLPAYTFSSKMIKKLYFLRWNEETAFRHLKYAGSMVHIHSLKKEFYIQEIYAKLTLYNFSSYINSSVENVERKTDKYLYVKNHTQVQKLCLKFLKGKIKDIKGLIARYLVPVRPDRKFARNLRSQSAKPLTYR